MPLFSLSQGSVNYISLLPEHFKIENRNFYISKVIDERKNKFSLGISQVGPFNKKAVTKFKNGLENSFFNFMTSPIIFQPTTDDCLILIYLKSFCVKSGNSSPYFKNEKKY